MLSLTSGHVTGSDEKRRVAFLLSLQEQEQGRQCTRPFHAVHPNDSRLWNGLAHETTHPRDCALTAVLLMTHQPFNTCLMLPTLEHEISTLEINNQYRAKNNNTKSR